MKSMQINYKNGFTLLELLLALVIITTLVLLSVRYYVLASTNEKVVDTMNKFKILADASYKWVEGQNGDFCGGPQSAFCNYPEGISAQGLVEAGLITAQDIASPWAPAAGCDPSSITQGCIRVQALSDNHQRVEILLSGIPAKVCLALEQKFKDYAFASNCYVNEGSNIYEAAF